MLVGPMLVGVSPDGRAHSAYSAGTAPTIVGMFRQSTPCASAAGPANRVPTNAASAKELKRCSIMHLLGANAERGEVSCAGSGTRASKPASAPIYTDQTV